MNILLRDLKWDDLKALEDVIRVTWNYDRFASPKTAKKLAKVYWHPVWQTRPFRA